MLSFEGEYAHPYIDRELDRPGVRGTVQSLIDGEKGLPPDPADWPPPPPTAIDYPGALLSRDAQGEDLGNQQAILHAVLTEGTESSRSEIRALEALVESELRQKGALLGEIDRVTRMRQDAQHSAISEIERLGTAERKTRHTIEALKAAIARKKEALGYLSSAE
jgi:hypothetical protein